MSCAGVMSTILPENVQSRRFIGTCRESFDLVPPIRAKGYTPSSGGVTEGLGYIDWK